MAQNASSIRVAENAIHNAWTYNISVAYHFTSVHLSRMYLTIAYSRSNDNTEDQVPAGFNSIARHGQMQGLVLSEWEREVQHAFCALLELILWFTCY